MRTIKAATIYQARTTNAITNHTRLSPIRGGLAPGFVNYKLEAKPTEPVSFT
jgi:hypothetical protein